MPKGNNDCKISVVVATYHRADALRETLGSLIDQRHENWEGIVVGDCAELHTAEVVRSLGDPRIRYYRLPERFGEQSGPNSLGLAAAQGRYVTFLNHDDLILPDHFERMLAAMPPAGNGFVMGGAVTVVGATGTGGAAQPVFGNLVRPPGLKPVALFMLNFQVEPSSSWLVDRQLASAVGSWRPAAELMRTPIQDWHLRAVRQGARIILLDPITTFYLIDRPDLPPGTRLYDRSADVNRAVLAWIRRVGVEAARLEVRRQFDPQNVREGRRRSRSVGDTARNAAANVAFSLFRWSGLDLGALYLRVRGRRRGWWNEGTLPHRTGESVPRAPNLGELIGDPERCRVF